ncbi:hypothetical protein SUDANB1_05234 [Streptomyces sp. enrichment culture]|uniref:hypothetical protein n=1 Tax=Streptomyces sp. enrichment culture TaxID=1795815 RepID=UPI003F5759B5
MCSRARLHASLRRDELPARDATTGEIRVPLALYDLDEHRGDVPLVMSRAEAEALFAHLRVSLLAVPEQSTARPEVVR